MTNALSMTPTDRLDQLREVKVRDVNANTLIRLNLVEQVSSLRELQRQPNPRIVLPAG